MWPTAVSKLTVAAPPADTSHSFEVFTAPRRSTYLERSGPLGFVLLLSVVSMSGERVPIKAAPLVALIKSPSVATYTTSIVAMHGTPPADATDVTTLAKAAIAPFCCAMFVGELVDAKGKALPSAKQNQIFGRAMGKLAAVLELDTVDATEYGLASVCAFLGAVVDPHLPNFVAEMSAAYGVKGRAADRLARVLQKIVTGQDIDPLTAYFHGLHKRIVGKEDVVDGGGLVATGAGDGGGGAGGHIAPSSGDKSVTRKGQALPGLGRDNQLGCFSAPPIDWTVVGRRSSVTPPLGSRLSTTCDSESDSDFRVGVTV